jgi:hypothetical protein
VRLAARVELWQCPIAPLEGHRSEANDSNRDVVIWSLVVGGRLWLTSYLITSSAQAAGRRAGIAAKAIMQLAWLALLEVSQR